MSVYLFIHKKFVDVYPIFAKFDVHVLVSD